VGRTGSAAAVGGLARLLVPSGSGCAALLQPGRWFSQALESAGVVVEEWWLAWEGEGVVA
jgi:hypothetical protein